MWGSPCLPQSQQRGSENRLHRTWQARHSFRGSRSTHPSMICPCHVIVEALIDRIDFLFHSVDL